MSYLVDALKKAERERHDQRSADMQSVADSDAANRKQQSAGSRLLWIVVVLVVCNIGLFAYLMRPQAENSAPAAAEAATADTSATKASSAPNESQGLAFRAPGSDVPRSKSPEPRPAPSGNRSRADRRAAPVADDVRARGNVTYSRAPLDNNRLAPARQPRASSSGNRPAAGSQNRSAPRVQINGHLYSSIPGRSFILVNGRRYHEGERLAAGPAVESIDAKGATLNYRGRRYHIAGPG